MLNTYQYGTKYQMIQKRLDESSETKTKPIGHYMKTFAYLIFLSVLVINTFASISIYFWLDAFQPLEWWV
jgi:hypothetical protein